MGRRAVPIPVVTLVVYYGAEAWDGPKSLGEMLRLPREFERYPGIVGSYPMHLLEVQAIKDLEAYDDDLMALFGFIKYQKNQQELETFIRDHADYFNSMSRETYEAITGAADVREIRKYIENQNETEEIDMCDALKQMQEESMQKGMQKGAAEEKRKVALKMLQKNHPIPVIAELIELSEAEIKKIKESMQP